MGRQQATLEPISERLEKVAQDVSETLKLQWASVHQTELKTSSDLKQFHFLWSMAGLVGVAMYVNSILEQLAHPWLLFQGVMGPKEVALLQGLCALCLVGVAGTMLYFKPKSGPQGLMQWYDRSDTCQSILSLMSVYSFAIGIFWVACLQTAGETTVGNKNAGTKYVWVPIPPVAMTLIAKFTLANYQSNYFQLSQRRVFLERAERGPVATSGRS